jgi:hypothetical protein
MWEQKEIDNGMLFLFRGSCDGIEKASLNFIPKDRETEDILNPRIYPDPLKLIIRTKDNGVTYDLTLGFYDNEQIQRLQYNLNGELNQKEHRLRALMKKHPGDATRLREKLGKIPAAHVRVAELSTSYSWKNHIEVLSCQRGYRNVDEAREVSPTAPLMDDEKARIKPSLIRLALTFPEFPAPLRGRKYYQGLIDKF